MRSLRYPHLRRFISSQLFVILMATLLAAPAAAQATAGWRNSDDVGKVTTAGSATENNGIWTVSGEGSDIWGTADSFQFLHQTVLPSVAVLTVRVDDVQNTDPYAKAGLMMRAGPLTADAATVLLSVKPSLEVEILVRASNGTTMRWLPGPRLPALPAWLRLERTLNGGVNAWVSQDSRDWLPVAEEVPVQLGPPFEAGVAVTSHHPGQLNTAHFGRLSLDVVQPGWTSLSVGDVSALGNASEENGTWAVQGAGTDIWGTDDSFQFLSQNAHGSDQHVVARVTDLKNTHQFAKAGLMLRTSLDSGAPAVIVDVKPDGSVEYMARFQWGAPMVYLGGRQMPALPTWLQLSWKDEGDGKTSIVTATASTDKVNWSELGPPFSVQLPYTYEVGLAITSHDPNRLNTAHVQGLSLLSRWESSDEIGDAGLVGNAWTSFANCCALLVAKGAGSDIWGAADSFEFVHGSADTAGNVHALSSRVPVMQATHAFGKAGLMFRDSLDPGAMDVIVDVKPDGGVEFMARLCTGCETTFLGGTTLTFPVYLTLFRFGTSYQAQAASNPFGTWTQLGSIDVPMSAPIPGLAVTSHDPGHIADALFDDPPR